MRTGHDPDDMELVKHEIAKAFSWRLLALAGSYTASSDMWKDCAERVDTKRPGKKWRVSTIYPPSQNRRGFLNLKCSLLPWANFGEMQQSDQPVDSSCSTKPTSFCLSWLFLAHWGGLYPFAGVWPEGFSFAQCGGLGVFQPLLSLKELLAGNKSPAIFRGDLSGWWPKATKALAVLNGAVLWFVITYQDHVMASLSTVASTLPISTAVIRL